ncbi:Uncharacterized conserved protein, DUF1499 family [Sulfitobacter brevis]|uniref:Uncharacterized conserved protein, DUF1499 family n=1 Tax=Sulfitobacter brevis TaxID=74348 RepID=A0A1I1USV3_9RHOB|nr:DUF1499 domain-containing protein [Sulfitobacter brevis]SFD71893.1 Uncharacterized conserved protein, DUF1499 family [Sulfitobacter brevis]
MIGWILLLLVIGLLVYVRIAPSDAKRWNAEIDATQDSTTAGSATRVIVGDAATFARIHRAALALPRTEILSGSVEDGKVTYITRSNAIGFPDYTTVQLIGDQIRMFARLRFGTSDLGVNRGRLEHLVRAAQP